MNTPESRTLVLSNGKRLCYEIYGAPDLRVPVFYFHGFPGSRYEALAAEKVLAKLQVSLIAPDRPGFGGSEYVPGRRLADWPRTVAELADHLGVKNFRVLGVSGGTPYAFACAHALPERVQALAVVSGLAELARPELAAKMQAFNRLLIVLNKRAPKLLIGLMELLRRWWLRRPYDLLRYYRLVFSKSDRSLLRRAKVSSALELNARTALCQHARAIYADFAILNQPWGFSLAEIKQPSQIWHGAADHYVPAGMAETLARELPNAELKIIEDGGHLLCLSILERVLSALLRPGGPAES